jgi:hypothetical protein
VNVAKSKSKLLLVHDANHVCPAKTVEFIGPIELSGGGPLRIVDGPTNKQSIRGLNVPRCWCCSKGWRGVGPHLAPYQSAVPVDHYTVCEFIARLSKFI